MFRVAVSKQTQPVQTTDPDKFDICLLAQLYRVNQAWPVPKDKVALSSLHNANLATNNGAYTYLLSPCVSEKKKLEPGVYILVVTTYEPDVHADFNVILYTQHPT